MKRGVAVGSVEQAGHRERAALHEVTSGCFPGNWEGTLGGWEGAGVASLMKVLSYVIELFLETSAPAVAAAAVTQSYGRSRTSWGPTQAHPSRPRRLMRLVVAGGRGGEPVRGSDCGITNRVRPLAGKTAEIYEQ